MNQTQKSTYQLGAILEDIAARAHKIERLTVEVADRLNDIATADVLCAAVIDMAQRIGWLADLAASQTPGLTAYAGNAEQWMLPAHFRRSPEAGSLNTLEG